MNWILGLSASAAAILVHTLNMRKVWWGPIAGVLAEYIWLAYICKAKAWELLPMAVFYLMIYALAILKWKRER